MKNNIPQKSKPERAQSLVEFAISLLLILTILTGAVEVSLALFEYITLSNAAQEGALYGSINPNDGLSIRARVRDAANDGVMLKDDQIGVGIMGSGPCEKTDAGTTNQIKVTITYWHQIMMPLVGTFVGELVDGKKVIRMDVSATNTILQPACP